MSAPPNPASSTSPQTQAKGSRVFKSKSSSQSKSDWLAASLTTAKLIAAGAECIPFPYVKGVFGTVVVILETVEKVKRNRDDLKELCGNIVEIIKIIQDQLVAHGDTGALKFKGLCEDLASVLEGVLQSIKELSTKPRGLSGRFKEVMKLGSTADEIAGYRMRIQELRSNFVLMAAIDTNLQVHKAFSTGRLADLSTAPATQTITKCPPPSRIFHGRQNILDKMHRFFEQDLDKQHIYLLHGLGGAGKTQIGLKFIEEFSARTTETIDTGLKNIAATQNAGSTAQDSLDWLSSKPAEWLLFFDNADDTNINLNNYFPRCKHGNILITSRNPRLRVYAGSDSLVSNMEETDAVELLLTSAAQAFTPENKEIAADIVQTLYYFPLAIIQAGAFISKSGALSSYLNIYAQNQARLLSEQPDQSHDDYARTVYTTWQISFDQLSKPAATLLQLCSFLHHTGISEDIFSRASAYPFFTNGPSEEELHDPLEFLSQFHGPTGVWNPLQFMDVMNEITAYSLANFDPDGKLYSIHPLVHTWSRSTLADQGQYLDWMIAIVGMSISGIPNRDMQLPSLKLLPHVDSLLCGNTNISPDFRRDYGRLYYYAGRSKDAEQLYLAVLEHQRSVLGEDHLGTLYDMGALASIYTKLGKLQEAEELGVVVLEKRRKILGEDHPDTLLTMGNLADTYQNLGKLQEAEELGVVVLEKWRKILGEDHPDTLRAMGNLASTYRRLGKLQEAEELEVVVLEKRRKILGEDHPDTLRTMGNLASTYHKQGKLQEAEELEVVVLEKRRKILGEDHPDTLLTMGNHAWTYYMTGKFKKAEELGVVVLEKRRKILGEDHPDTLHTMGNLADTYENLGKLQEAEELGVLVLEKLRKILGEDHLDTLRAMGNLASTYRRLGKLQEAEELEVVVLEKRRKILGEDHPDTLRTMGNLASTYHKQGKLQEAEELEVVVLEKQRKILGEDHPETLHAMGNLASSYHNLGKWQEAEELEVVVLEKRRKILGEDHPDTLHAMGNLASTYHRLGKLQEAEEVEVVVLEKRRKILGEDHPETLWIMGNLASTYHKLGKLQEAEEVDVVVLEKQRKILGEDHSDTLQTMGNLAATCYYLNKFKEAEQLYVELLDRQTALLGADHPDTLRTANWLSSKHQTTNNNSQDDS
ncbi:hypothetical protein DFH09DRAFT_1281707 [Mycena vulgaris]|nr:hypothetical protein DFH09DRAFT_1281707 [Mycena vulgaris]